LAGKPTVRRAQLPGGNRMTEKRMPVAERQREATTIWPVLQLAGRGGTGRISGLVPGRESALTRSGELVKRKKT
jgi:hypothetical protein